MPLITYLYYGVMVALSGHVLHPVSRRIIILPANGNPILISTQLYTIRHLHWLLSNHTFPLMYPYFTVHFIHCSPRPTIEPHTRIPVYVFTFAGPFKKLRKYFPIEQGVHKSLYLIALAGPIVPMETQHPSFL